MSDQFPRLQHNVLAPTVLMAVEFQEKTPESIPGCDCDFLKEGYVYYEKQYL